ncbi:MAG: hypothetical protein ACFFEA_02125 [Candidatus Thorarchaeota archaeon]
MQFEWIIDIILAMVGFLVLFVITMIIISILILGWALRYVNGTNTEFFSVAITAILMSILTAFIPCLGCIIALYIIKLRHEVGWGGAIIAWILAAIVSLAIALLIMILFFGGIAALIDLIPFLPLP